MPVLHPCLSFPRPILLDLIGGRPSTPEPSPEGEGRFELPLGGEEMRMAAIGG